MPEFKKKFTLKTDANNTGLGAVLLKENKDGVMYRTIGFKEAYTNGGKILYYRKKMLDIV